MLRLYIRGPGFHCIQYSRNLIGKGVYCYLTLFLWVHKVRPPLLKLNYTVIMKQVLSLCHCPSRCTIMCLAKYEQNVKN